MFEARLVTIEDRLDRIEAGQARLEAGQAKLEAGQVKLEAGVAKLEVNAEVMRDEIKQIAEGHAATQAAIARSTEEVIAHINKRIDPLEAAVRAHFHQITLP